MTEAKDSLRMAEGKCRDGPLVLSETPVCDFTGRPEGLPLHSAITKRELNSLRNKGKAMYNEDMERQEFEALVFRAIEALPAEFRSKLENVDIIVEDWPSPNQISRLGLRYKTQLLGLYEGVPQTKRDSGYNLVLPDKITIFQKPIELKCRSDKEIEMEVGRVVRHEIAHHFGIGDAALYRIESQKLRKNSKNV
jgi:predicted Zn-dependent protease with MMP-like domain